MSAPRTAARLSTVPSTPRSRATRRTRSAWPAVATIEPASTAPASSQPPIRVWPIFPAPITATRGLPPLRAASVSMFVVTFSSPSGMNRGTGAPAEGDDSALLQRHPGLRFSGPSQAGSTGGTAGCSGQILVRNVRAPRAGVSARWASSQVQSHRRSTGRDAHGQVARASPKRGSVSVRTGRSFSKLRRTFRSDCRPQANPSTSFRAEQGASYFDMPAAAEPAPPSVSSRANSRVRQHLLLIVAGATPSPPMQVEHEPGHLTAAFVNGGDDLLGRHPDASPLPTALPEALHSRLPSFTLLIPRRNQMRDGLAMTRDRDRLAVLDGPQELRQVRLGLGCGNVPNGTGLGAC